MWRFDSARSTPGQAPDRTSTIVGLPFAPGFKERNLALSAGQLPGHRTPCNAPGHAFKVRLARSAGVQREATLLVNERYMARGYGPQELKPLLNRMTIVAYHGTLAIGTISVGFDSVEEGLLCDDLYPREVDTLRARERRVCEFIKLAVQAPSASMETLAALFHVAFLHAYKVRGFEDVVMEINPRHVRFYRRELGFRQLGQPTLNRRVQATGVLMHAELADIETRLRHFMAQREAPIGKPSIYPGCFDLAEEQGILQRLRAVAVTQHGQ